MSFLKQLNCGKLVFSSIAERGFVDRPSKVRTHYPCGCGSQGSGPKQPEVYRKCFSACCTCWMVVLLRSEKARRLFCQKSCEFNVKTWPAQKYFFQESSKPNFPFILKITQTRKSLNNTIRKRKSMGCVSELLKLDCSGRLVQSGGTRGGPPAAEAGGLGLCSVLCRWVRLFNFSCSVHRSCGRSVELRDFKLLCLWRLL